MEFLIQFLFFCMCLAFAVVWQYVLYHQSFNLRKRQLKEKKLVLLSCGRKGSLLNFTIQNPKWKLNGSKEKRIILIVKLF